MYIHVIFETLLIFDNILFAFLVGSAAVPLTDIPDEFKQAIQQDLKETEEALKLPTMEYGLFYAQLSKSICVCAPFNNTFTMLLGWDKSMG